MKTAKEAKEESQLTVDRNKTATILLFARLFSTVGGVISQACSDGRFYAQYAVRHRDFNSFVEYMTYYGFEVDDPQYDDFDQTKLVTFRWSR